MVEKSKLEQSETQRQLRHSHQTLLHQYTVTACFADYIEAHNHFQRGGPALRVMAAW
ncbi:hypothetical protein GUITHDRAFT_151042 [Guillardia theta CCMP2712]|uniref:Uncharacterized protein n=1 Tax=Guillardia theta (strain CCMP2712) TaxID=905079 RepID=L1JTD1_GUITC|nr:hypothetical protein GUITHDRAFT_151042 [Guillardia theta CCMP2712]EKX51328.1 hypothetical protein GUITHDRAFT_151042 [Guillardia theta CCMP2712]|eukprot:XP_005838308.1 hypothetical protein GUITHDRAFT_151042 [Guillardia theta CCMP2712]